MPAELLKKPLSDEEKDRIGKVFKKYDKDGSGTIDLKELHDMLKDLGADLNDEEVANAMRELDKDSNMTCNMDEFVGFWSSDPKCGGYSNLTLQFMKAALVMQSRMDTMKQHRIGNMMANAKGEASQAGNITFKAQTSISPGMVGCDPKMSVNAVLKKGGSELTGVKLQMAATSAEAAESVVKSLEQFLPMLADAPFKINFSNAGDKVLTTLTMPQDLLECMMVDLETSHMIKFVDSAVTDLDAKASWSNDLGDITKNAASPLIDFVGAYDARGHVTVSAGAVATMLGDMPPFIADSLMIPAGADVSVNVGYYDQRVKAFLAVFKAMANANTYGYRSEEEDAFVKKIPNQSLADARELFYEIFLRTKRAEFQRDLEENAPPEAKQMIQAVKDLAPKIVSIDSITCGLSPVITRELVISFESFNPFPLVAYMMESGDNSIAKAAKIVPKKELTSAQEEQLLSVFKKFDKDSSGKIDISELKTVIAELGGKMSDSEAAESMKQLDTNGDGQGNYEEFKDFWCSKPGLGGYSSLALKFLKMKIAVEGALDQSTTYFRGNGKPVNESDDTAVKISAGFTPEMEPCQTKMSISGSVGLAVGDVATPSVVLRLLANSEEHASTVVTAIQAVIAQVTAAGMVPEEMIKEMLSIEQSNAHVLIKATYPPVVKIFESAASDVESWDGLAALAEAVRSKYDINFKLGLGNSFEDFLLAPDKPVTQVFNGVQVDVTVSVSQKAKSSLLSMLSLPMSMRFFEAVGGYRQGPITKAFFTTALRLYAGTEIKVFSGFHKDALDKFVKSVIEGGMLPEQFTNLNGLRDAILQNMGLDSGSPGEEEKAMIKPMIAAARAILEGLKAVESITVGPVPVPLPEHEGEAPKVELKVIFDHVAPFSLVKFMADPILNKLEEVVQ